MKRGWGIIVVGNIPIDQDFVFTAVCDFTITAVYIIKSTMKTALKNTAIHPGANADPPTVGTSTIQLHEESHSLARMMRLGAVS